MRKDITFLLTILILGPLCGCIQTAEEETPEPGTGYGEIKVIIYEKFGGEEVLDTVYRLLGGECAMDALRSVADVETSYGGGFVNAINGIGSGYRGSQSTKGDWFYYINGISANTGAADYILHEGDVVRWDYHEWSYQTFIPAIIGDFPEPFLHGVRGKIPSTVIIYGNDEFRDEAYELKDSLIRLGVKEINVKLPGNLGDSERGRSNIILIGYSTNKLIDEVMENHGKLGFFAYFEDNKVVILNPGGERVEKAGGAVILATQNPWNPKGTGAFENVVWIISGTDEKEIEDAAVILSRKHELLRNHFGIFIHNKEIISVPYNDKL